MSVLCGRGLLLISFLGPSFEKHCFPAKRKSKRVNHIPLFVWYAPVSTHFYRAFPFHFWRHTNKHLSPAYHKNRGQNSRTSGHRVGSWYTRMVNLQNNYVGLHCKTTSEVQYDHLDCISPVVGLVWRSQPMSLRLVIALCPEAASSDNGAGPMLTSRNTEHSSHESVLRVRPHLNISVVLCIPYRLVRQSKWKQAPSCSRKVPGATVSKQYMQCTHRCFELQQMDQYQS